MADAYLTISQVAADPSMRSRVAAAAVQQGVPPEEGEGWSASKSLAWASSPSWAEKWDYAVAGDNPSPGSDPAVITDGDILATVQGMLAT